MSTQTTPAAIGEQSTSRDRLLDAGRRLFWHRGFNDVGLNEILKQAGVPKGSFYHHFTSKERFGVEVVDHFAADSLAILDHFVQSDGPALDRLRRFFESQRAFYAGNGCRDGCLLGNFGQELAESSEPLRQRIEAHLERVRGRLESCLDEAQQRGELGSELDVAAFADVLLSAWHGALLRMKVEKNLRPVDAFLAFHLPPPES